MPAIAYIEIRTDPPQVVGSVVRHIIAPDDRGPFEATYALNGESRATLALPTDAEAWAHVRRMDCLRVVYVDGTARSWRVADDSLTEDERTGELTLTACEILLDLADVRVLRNENTGTEPQLARSYAPMTPAEILGDVLRELHDVGEAAHIQLGTVEPTALITHDRTWTTALEVLRAVASHPQVVAEYRLREEADAFYLDLLQRVGADLPAVHVWYGGDLGALVRQRAAAQVASVVIPRGDGTEVTCGATVLEVTEVTPDYIRVRDPEAPAAPVIVFDGQFVGSYAVRPVDGSLRRVVASSATTQALYLTGAAQFTPGDLFEFRRDLAGNRLVTRTNPGAARARHQGGIGRIERVVQVGASHAGRNYVRNPFFRSWRLDPDGQVRPVGWSTKARGMRRLNVPGSPSGMTALLRSAANVPLITDPLPAGSTSAATLFARTVRPGETCEIWAGGAKVHTVTVTGATAGLITWAEPTPALIAGPSMRPVGLWSVAGVNVLTSDRIRVADDVTLFSVAAHVWVPPVSGVGSGLTLKLYRYRPGVGGRTLVDSVPTDTPETWETLQLLAYAHTPGDTYEVVIEQHATPLALGEVMWVAFTAGAELPPHEFDAGQFLIPEHSGANRLHRIAQASLLEMAPDRASYQLRLADVLTDDGQAVPADRFALGAQVWLHHERLESAVSARLLTMVDHEDDPAGPTLTLDSTQPDVARTLALLLGGRAGATPAGDGALSGPWPVTAEAFPANGGLVAGAGRYVRGQPVELVAVPQPGFVFRRWLEGAAVVADTLRLAFVADRARSLTAEFQYQPPGDHAITTTVSPAGWGTVTGAGSYAHNASVTVTATPRPGYSFSAWMDGGVAVSVAAAYTFPALASRDLVAVFVVTPPGTSAITVAASPAGFGTVSGGGVYTNGDVASVDAVPAVGRAFSRWTEGGQVVSPLSTYVFQVTGPRALVAEFLDNPAPTWTVAASASPAGTGTVTGAGTYTDGESVTVTATPATGYRFRRWMEGGSAVSISASFAFTATGNRTLVAEFEPVPPGPWTVSVQVAPADNYGDVVGLTNPYEDGAQVTLTAVPIGGKVFLRWADPQGFTYSEDASIEFTATGHLTLVAEFGLGGGEDT